MKRKLVIGDIHGGFKALEQVLHRANVAPGDELVFLGDYVDGWSGSFDVIEFLIHLQEKQKCLFIRGNHDTWCEDWLGKGVADPTWAFHGGKSTMESYAKADRVKRNEHLDFFNRMTDYHIDDQNRLFIHAGFSSMHGPSMEHHRSNYSWDRTLWEMALSMDPTIDRESDRFPKRLKHFDEIYIGHTPTTGYGRETPMNVMNVWNADTGAAFHGKLTALDVDTKEFWQSDTVRALYPNEKGRNKY